MYISGEINRIWGTPECEKSSSILFLRTKKWFSGRPPQIHYDNPPLMHMKESPSIALQTITKKSHKIDLLKSVLNICNQFFSSLFILLEKTCLCTTWKTFFRDKMSAKLSKRMTGCSCQFERERETGKKSEWNGETKTSCFS